MIVDLLVLVSLAALLGSINALGIGSFLTVGDHSALAFGFILLTSYVTGRIVRRWGLPMITGYLLAGLIFGPYVLGNISPSLRILSPQILDELSIFNSIALGLIAFSAGGEVKIDAIRKRLKSIAYVTGGQVVGAALLAPILWLALPLFLAFKGAPINAVLASAALFSVLAMANSPSTTLALILESRAKGPLTTTSLGVTILKDVLVIVMFSVVMVAAKALMAAQGELDVTLLLLLLWEVAGSLAIGLGLGYLMGQYMKYVGRELPLILLALALVAIELALDFHLSGLLLCMAAGFYVVNFTESGNLLIRAIAGYSMPVFVLFFTITGAELQLPLLVHAWPLVLTLVVLRTVSIWAGSTTGSALAKDSSKVRKNVWLGFVSQAGVTLGLAMLIGQEIPHIGQTIQTIVVATVAINQLVGPVLFRIGLVRVGEAQAE